MTTLIYSLEEAARNLGMSETVLVRLSQYFRIPQAAYEEGNYLSFKGDLGFTGHDIAFFAQVRDRILAGDSLEDIRQRVRYDSIAPKPEIPVPPRTTSAVPEKGGGDPMQRMAEKSFRRYKEANQTSPGGVFKKMMHRVGEEPEPEAAPPRKLSPRGLSDALGSLFPRKPSVSDPLALKDQGILPPKQPGLPKRDPLPEMTFPDEAEKPTDGLNPALRQAALRLREKAMQQPGSQRVFRR